MDTIHPPYRGKRLDNGELVQGDLMISCTVKIANREGEYKVDPQSVAKFVGVSANGGEVWVFENFPKELDNV